MVCSDILNSATPALFFRMRILITAPSLREDENVSGISSSVRQIIESLPHHEFRHFQAGRRDSEGSADWIRSQAILLPKLNRMIREFDPDIVHVNTAATLRALIRDVAIAMTARKKRIPVIVHVHGGEFLTTGFESPGATRAMSALLKCADHSIALNEEDKQRLFNIRSSIQIDVVSNAVDTSSIKIREFSDQPLRLLYMGRIDRNKGLDDIVESISMLSEKNAEPELELLGTGPDEDAFVSDLGGLLGERLHFHGVVAGEDKMEIIRRSDLFLLPSRFEGVPLALLETMAMGVVPIVSKVGGMGRIVDHGRNGYLVNPGRPDKITSAVEAFLGLSLQERREMGVRARNTIENDFDLARQSTRLDEVYKTVAGIKG